MTNIPPEFLDKWRKYFEAVIAADSDLRRSVGRDGSELGYRSLQTAYMWEGFLMRCQTAVIELPMPDCRVASCYLSEATERIESQGYRVEVKGDLSSGDN